MPETLILGTEDGLLLFDVEEGQARLRLHTLLGHYVAALAHADDAVLASIPRYGLCRLDPSQWSPTWTLEAHVLVLASHPVHRRLCLAGAEPATLYRSDDAGRSWRELPALRQRPEASAWYHPAPSSLPHVLGLALHPHNPNAFYAGIEVGGVFKSTDGGASFTPVNRGLYPDIHRLALHPQRPDELWAVTGQGLYRSQDGGALWGLASRGMSRRYAAALAVVTGPVCALLASAAHGPPWNAAYGASAVIFRSTSDGDRWEAAMDGLPPTLDGVPTAFAASLAQPGRVYAAVASGALLASDNAGRSWSLLAADLPSAQALLCLPPHLTAPSGRDSVLTEAYGPLSAAGAHPLH